MRRKISEGILKSWFQRRFPKIAPLTVYLAFKECGEGEEPHIKLYQDRGFEVYLPPGFYQADAISSNRVPWGGTKYTTDRCILHELLHILNRHHIPPFGKDTDVDVWYIACEYWLKRYMIRKGLEEEFYQKWISKVEEYAPEVVNAEDPITIYRILLRKKEKSGRSFETKGSGCAGFEIVGEQGSGADTQSGSGMALGGGVIDKIIAKLIGSGQGDILEDISPIDRKKLPWDVRLKMKVAEWLEEIKYDYSEPSEETLYDFRAVYPSIHGTVSRIGVAVDVSSSMSIDEIKNGLAYVVNDYKIEAIVTHSDGIHQIFTDIEQLKNARVGGGTSYKQVVEWFKDNHPGLPVVWITDGECNDDIPDDFDVFFVFTYPMPKEKYLKFNHIIV